MRDLSSDRQPTSLRPENPEGERGQSIATSGAMLSAERIFVMIGTREIAIHAKVFENIPGASFGTTDVRDLTTLFGKYAYNPETVDYIVHILHLRYVFDLSANQYDFLTYNERLFQMLRHECASEIPLPMHDLLGGDPWFKQTVCKFHKDLDFHHWMFGNRGNRIKAMNERTVLDGMRAFWSAGVLYIIGYDSRANRRRPPENAIEVAEYEAPLMMPVADPTHPESIWEEKILKDLRPYRDAKNLIYHYSEDYTDDWKEAAVGKAPGVRIIARPPIESTRWKDEAPIFLHTHVPVKELRSDALYVVDDTFRVEEKSRGSVQTPFNSFVTSSTRLVSRNSVTRQQFITYDAFPNWYEIRDSKTRRRVLIEHTDIEPLVQPYNQPIDLQQLVHSVH